jgi:phosphonate transport system permease protein
VSVTTEPPRSGAAVQPARPAKPPPNWFMWGGLAVVVLITWWAARQIGFTVRPLFTDDLTRGTAVIARFFNPNWGYIFEVWQSWLETLYIAVIAGLVGNGVALFLSLLASKVSSPNRGVYLVFKNALSVLRSLPDVAYALFFVAAVGSGPLAGIIALIFFNIGVNAKLTSETIDGVDVGPIEAADAGGANRFQRAWAAVVPQIMPNYTSYSLYVFELNLRASLVIGYVGAGGIGQVIQVQFARFNFENVGAIVVALFVIVFALDRLSIYLRRRLV